MNLNKINFGELWHVVKIAAEVHPDRFDMSTWGERKPSCGTVACLVGHYDMQRPAYGMVRNGDGTLKHGEDYARVFRIPEWLFAYLFHTHRHYIRVERSYGRKYVMDAQCLGQIRAIHRAATALYHLERRRRLWAETEEINHGPRTLRKQRMTSMPTGEMRVSV